MIEIRLARSDEEILACQPVMVQLRPHVAGPGFLERVRRQATQGYLLVFVSRDGDAVACAGYRYGENLAWGRFLYVDDLVTAQADRSRGYGERLFHWLVDEARRTGCEQLHLDSGVQRFAAHRFYLRECMDITSHHFALRL